MANTELVVGERLHRGQAPLAMIAMIYGLGYLFVPSGTKLSRGLDIMEDAVPLWIPGALWFIAGLLCAVAVVRKTVSSTGIGMVTGLFVLWGGFYLLGFVEQLAYHEPARSWLSAGLHLGVAWLVMASLRVTKAKESRG